MYHWLFLSRKFMSSVQSSWSPTQRKAIGCLDSRQPHSLLLLMNVIVDIFVDFFLSLLRVINTLEGVEDTFSWHSGPVVVDSIVVVIIFNLFVFDFIANRYFLSKRSRWSNNCVADWTGRSTAVLSAATRRRSHGYMSRLSGNDWYIYKTWTTCRQV